MPVSLTFTTLNRFPIESTISNDLNPVSITAVDFPVEAIGFKPEFLAANVSAVIGFEVTDVDNTDPSALVVFEVVAVLPSGFNPAFLLASVSAVIGSFVIDFVKVEVSLATAGVAVFSNGFSPAFWLTS